MSVALTLIPFAIAAISAISTSSREYYGQEVCEGEEGEIKVKTGIKDKDILLSSLYNYGYKYEIEGEDIITHMGDTQVTFSKNGQNIYDAFLLGENLSIDKSEIDIQDIYDEYRKVVQQNVYENIIDNAQDKGMKLQSEEVMEDNSILLTFDIKG